MSVSQISVFIESEPGHLVRVLDSFVEAGVNVRGYSASDTGELRHRSLHRRQPRCGACGAT